MKIEESYKKQIGSYLGARQEDLFLHGKGRQGLYALLKAVGLGPGDEVILPAFTCVVVANAIKYLGASPIYVDIDKSLNVPMTNIIPKVNQKTKVILWQYSFGINADPKPLMDFVAEKDIFVFEDATHAFGIRNPSGTPGEITDGAFFSTQWNKPFSTGIGGFVYSKNEILKPFLKAFQKELKIPSSWSSISFAGQIWARKNLLTPRTYWALRGVYRWLSSMSLVSGSSNKKELDSLDMPRDYFYQMSPAQIKAGSKALTRFDQLIQQRKKSQGFYIRELQEKHHLNNWGIGEGSVLLKYPILVKDRKAFSDKAEKANIPLGDWFNSPLHPIQGDLTLYDYKGDCPIAQKVSKHILNLETDFTLNSALKKKSSSFFDKEKGELISIQDLLGS